jgi:lipopolysaccharide export LptBFGC system permease protein LptF
MWRLAHAHGTLLALVNIAFACSLPHVGVEAHRLARLRRSSACLLVAALMLPAGFFLGGVFASSADPNPLVALVPAGAALLIAAAWTLARSVR